MDKLIYDTGYGMVPKSIMYDEDVSLAAKGVFSYLTTYTNGFGDIAFPSRDLMCKHLGVSKDSITKYIKELKEKGYLEVSQEIGPGGKFKHNIYKLIPYPKIPDTVKPDTVNSPLTIINNNNNNKNNIYTDKKKTIKEPRHKYGEFKNVLLSDKDLEKLKTEYGEELVEKYIKKMDEWIELNGRRYKNYYLALRQWMNKEVSKKQEKVEKQEGDTKYDEEYFTKLMEETLRGGNKF